MHCLKTAALILLLTINSGALSQSADLPASRLTAYQCGDLQKPLRMTVQVLDDADRFLAFKRHFEKELRAAGVTVGVNEPVVVTLDVRTVREFQGASSDPVIELRAGQENTDIGKDGTVRFRGNVWSSKGSSVLGGPKRSSDRRSLNQLQVTANVNRQSDGHCLWQGEVVHDLGNDDEDQATQQIITILTRNLGTSAANRPISIFP